MNIFRPSDDSVILHWKLSPGAGFAWTAKVGEELIDLPSCKKLVHVNCYNSYSHRPIDVTVGRRKDGSLSFSPGLTIWFQEECNPIQVDEVQTKILMDPEFSLEEIEQAQEVMDNLQ